MDRQPSHGGTQVFATDIDDHYLESLAPRVHSHADRYGAELIDFRRTMHRDPEIAFSEHRATQRVAERLRSAGLSPVLFPEHTGLYCDIGDPTQGMVGIRADLDALAVTDTKNVPYKSMHPGLCHACGHDVHTATVLGAGLVLSDLAREGVLPNSVRLIFQPAEEAMPGGAVQVIRHGTLKPLRSVYALHCDPTVEVGKVGLRVGAITSATDHLELRVSAPADDASRRDRYLISAWGGMIALIQQSIATQIDPRSRVSVIWGSVQSHPETDQDPIRVVSTGTLRCTDEILWESAPDLLKKIVEDAARAYGVDAELTYGRGVPPTVNSASAIDRFALAAATVLGPEPTVQSKQSLAGEDFAWYLREIPGALARLGVRPVGQDEVIDLHKGDFNVDEQAILHGVKLLVMTVLAG
jgi:amidohydrolase